MNNLKILSKNAILFNLRIFSTHKICAMVKCNAYGHGLEEIVGIVKDKVEMFGVANVDEGVRVRKLTDKPILVCSRVQDLKKVRECGLEFFVSSVEEIEQGVAAGVSNQMHLKIDCGMNRYGAKTFAELEEVNHVLEKGNIQLKSICTHFPDTKNTKKTIKNYEIFLKKREKIAQNAKICFGGSGISEYPFKFDVLRLGLGMYGYGLSGLKKVMRIVSHVASIKFVEKGEFLGYGSAFKVKKSGFFAVVPIGYGDGLKRALSGRFLVKINNLAYRSFGLICMDAFFVRVDASVSTGDEVEIMWDAEDMAEKVGTISYEVLTGFSALRGEILIE